MSLSDDELRTAMQAWNLDTDNTKRTPYKRVKDRESIPVATRMDSLMVRRMDEILASQAGWPDYKTRSDIIQDSVAMWLERWDEDHPDSMTVLAHQFKAELSNRRRIARLEFYEVARNLLNGLREDGDLSGLQQFVGIIDESLRDFRQDAPASFLSKMDDLKQQARRLVDAHHTIPDP